MKKVAWIDGGHNMVHDGLVLSADKKVIKLWDREKVRVFYRLGVCAKISA